MEYIMSIMGDIISMTGAYLWFKLIVTGVCAYVLYNIIEFIIFIILLFCPETPIEIIKQCRNSYNITSEGSWDSSNSDLDSLADSMLAAERHKAGSTFRLYATEPILKIPRWIGACIVVHGLLGWITGLTTPDLNSCFELLLGISFLFGFVFFWYVDH